MHSNHAFIVGGTKGAGGATVRMLANEGYSISAISRNPATSAEEKAKQHYWTVDVVDTNKLEPVIEESLRLNGNFSSVVFFQRFRGKTDQWTGELETSLSATMRLIELLTTKFELKNCSIVVVSSANAHLVSKHLPVGYHVAKAGLNQMVRYYAAVLGANNIRVNSVSPGTFLKDETKHFVLSDPSIEPLYKRLVPLGRMGAADDVAHAISFLCSAKSSFITGQDLVVDGGTSLIYQEALAREFVPSN